MSESKRAQEALERVAKLLLREKYAGYFVDGLPVVVVGWTMAVTILKEEFIREGGKPEDFLKE